MDFDITSENDKLGSDGCLDFTNAANAGLPDLWCDDEDACPFKTLYDSVYSESMSRADYWIASANAVITNASPDQSYRLPFRWGREDRDICSSSSARLPEPTGCSEVENTFINRMNVTWTDAVALLGAHTLGRGDADFSGHPGTWVQSDDESTIFDKGFYQEVLNRGWRPRNDNDW